MKLINIGYGNVVLADKIVAIVSPESAPIKSLYLLISRFGMRPDIALCI